jgi:Domain of unknown function (DUF4431)
MRQTLAVMGALTMVSSPGFVAAHCLEYEPVSLYGTVVRQTYAGPPDYESVTSGDKPLVIWVLLPDQPVCVVDSNPRYPREYNEEEIQLLLSAEQYKQYANLLGKKVIVSGNLQHGGGRHYKRLVIAANDIRGTHVRP